MSFRIPSGIVKEFTRSVDSSQDSLSSETDMPLLRLRRHLLTVVERSSEDLRLSAKDVVQQLGTGVYFIILHAYFNLNTL